MQYVFWGVIIFAVIWVLVAFFTAKEAARKGRSYFLWLIAGFLFGFFALLAAYLVTENKSAILIKKLKDGSVKVCPACAESVLAAAAICRHCQHKFQI